jgi:hypothetical protein
MLNPPLSAARSRTHIVMAKRSEIHASLGLTTLITYGYKMCGIFAVHAMPRNAGARSLKLWDRDVSFCQVLRKCRHCVCRVLGGDLERAACVAAGNVSGRTPSGNWILLKFGVDCVTSLVNFGSERGGISDMCAELLSPSSPARVPFLLHTFGFEEGNQEIVNLHHENG